MDGQGVFWTICQIGVIVFQLPVEVVFIFNRTNGTPSVQVHDIWPLAQLG